MGNLVDARVISPEATILAILLPRALSKAA